MTGVGVRKRPGSAAPSAQVARRRQTTIAVIATLGGFLFGYDTGVVGGALIYISADLHLGASAQGWVVSSLLLGAAFGATFGGKIADKFGRKPVVRAAAAIFVMATLGSAFAPDAGILLLARVVLGFAVGCVSAVVPVYIGEIAPAERRGRLVNQNELMIVTGQLVAFVMNAVLIHLVSGNSSWRWMLGIAVIPAVLLLAGMSLVPETPRWLAQQNRLDDAVRVLQAIRPPRAEASEAVRLRETAQRPHEHEGRSGWIYLRARWIRILIAIGIGIAVCNQITGINTVEYYAPTILAHTGLGASTSLTASISIGVVGVIGVTVGMVLLGRLRRRPMLLTGFAGTTTFLLIIALLFLLPSSTTSSYLILAAMVVFVFFDECYVSTVTWLLLSELFPMKIRGFAMGIAVFLLWMVDFVISKWFPSVNAALGSTDTFLIFVGLGILALGFVSRYVPETKGRSLEDLEAGFRAQYSGKHSDAGEGAGG